VSSIIGQNDIYKSLLDNLYDGVYFVDRHRQITYWNKGAERLTGYKSEEVVGRHCADNILKHVDDNGGQLCKGLCPLSKTISTGTVHEAEVYLHHKDGHRVPVLVRLAPVHDSNGQIVGAVEVFSDNTSRVTAIKRVEALQGIAFLDALTGVGNRRYTEMNLQSRLEELRRYGWPFAVLFVDIDHFKRFNDKYGHNMGDEVLKTTAKTIVGSLRSFDFLGRWGGEEFLAIIENVDQIQVYGVANKLRSLVEQSALPVGLEKVRLTISIGATVARKDDTIESLISRADRLLYLSKSSGRNLASIG
jgi:diguanylate cyclase (GGDEF)-like protein/PAS domain S-box-containing protein